MLHHTLTLPSMTQPCCDVNPDEKCRFTYFPPAALAEDLRVYIPWKALCTMELRPKIMEVQSPTWFCFGLSGMSGAMDLNGIYTRKSSHNLPHPYARNVAIVTPASPSPCSPWRNDWIYFTFFKCPCTAFLSAPVPFPCTMRTLERWER